MNESGDNTNHPVPEGQDVRTDLDVRNHTYQCWDRRSPWAPETDVSSGLDTSVPWDANVPATPAGHGRHSHPDADAPDASKETDETELREGWQGQTPRLTLLRGGLRRTPTPHGAPMPAAPVTPIPPAAPLTAETATVATVPTRPATADARTPSASQASLSRYKPPLSGSPVWSADANWHDLTIRHDIAPLPAPPPAGWTRRWKVTYRHGVHDHSASVATVGEADLFAADPIRVNSWHRNKTARAGLRYLQATGLHHSHESLFERKFLCTLDFHGVTDVLSQPFTLTWHDGTRERNHSPDFLVLADGEITVVNTRPAQLVNLRLLEDCAAVAEVAMSRGWNHALVVGYPTPAFTVIDTVSAHAETPDHLGYVDDILDTLGDSPARFVDLVNRLSSPVMGRAVLQRLIWERQVSLDLRAPLEDHTLIALPGHEVVT